jgi:2,4-dienoyl-CoA reductase (NADPH2)
VDLFKAALPHILPDSRNISTSIQPTILFLQFAKEGELLHPVRVNFLKWCSDLLSRSGFTDATLHETVRLAKLSPDKEIHSVIEQGNHGLILICRDESQTWRERLLYKLRGKVVALLGSGIQRSRVLVPVDLSSTTLLVLMFLRQTFLGKSGFDLQFVHVQGGPAISAKQRWKELKRIVGIDEGFQLELVPQRKEIAAELLKVAKEGGYGTIIMGKRGLSGIKRWLLGSVSAGVLRGLTDQSLFLID